MTSDQISKEIDEHHEEGANASSSTTRIVTMARPMRMTLQSMQSQNIVSIPPTLSPTRYATKSYLSNLIEEEILALAREWDLDTKHLYILGSAHRSNSLGEAYCMLNPFIIKLAEFFLYPFTL